MTLRHPTGSRASAQYIDQALGTRVAERAWLEERLEDVSEKTQALDEAHERFMHDLGR